MSLVEKAGTEEALVGGAVYHEGIGVQHVSSDVENFFAFSVSELQCPMSLQLQCSELAFTFAV